MDICTGTGIEIDASNEFTGYVRAAIDTDADRVAVLPFISAPCSRPAG